MSLNKKPNPNIMQSIAIENLKQLELLLSSISLEVYTNKSKILSSATIGEHMRHILEFYLMLIKGSSKGLINYDDRARDKKIETDPLYADATIKQIKEGLDIIEENKAVYLDAYYTKSCANKPYVKSTLGRELAYCIEHSIHHMALIKATLISAGLSHLTDSNFGVAYSTIKYRNDSCVQ